MRPRPSSGKKCENTVLGEVPSGIKIKAIIFLALSSNWGGLSFLFFLEDEEKLDGF